jgi:hypothetical protein
MAARLHACLPTCLIACLYKVLCSTYDCSQLSVLIQETVIYTNNNYKILSSSFLAIFCENEVFGTKKINSLLCKIRKIFSLKIGQYGYQKIRIFTLISKM